MGGKGGALGASPEQTKPMYSPLQYNGDSVAYSGTRIDRNEGKRKRALESDSDCGIEIRQGEAALSEAKWETMRGSVCTYTGE